MITSSTSLSPKLQFAMCVSGHEKAHDFPVPIEEVGITWLAWQVSPYTTHQVISQLFTPHNGWEQASRLCLWVLHRMRNGGRALGMESHRTCLSEKGDNLRSEMPWHAAWDRVYTFHWEVNSNDHVYKLGTIAESED